MTPAACETCVVIAGIVPRHHANQLHDRIRALEAELASERNYTAAAVEVKMKEIREVVLRAEKAEAERDALKAQRRMDVDPALYHAVVDRAKKAEAQRDALNHILAKRFPGAGVQALLLERDELKTRVAELEESCRATYCEACGESVANANELFGGGRESDDRAVSRDGSASEFSRHEAPSDAAANPAAYPGVRNATDDWPNPSRLCPAGGRHEITEIFIKALMPESAGGGRGFHLFPARICRKCHLDDTWIDESQDDVAPAESVPPEARTSGDG